MRPEKVDVLTGWQEIADELGIPVRKAQRWEKQLGLPVERPKSSRVVMTTRAKLQAWADNPNAATHREGNRA